METVKKSDDLKRQYSSLATGEDLAEDYGDDTAGALKNRRAGVILHPTSLPGPYGTGEIGKEAYRFVDWMVSAKLGMWQVLPLVPPETQFWSPYSGLDALCGNTLLIAIDELVEEGLLDEQDKPKKVPVANADFPQIRKVKEPLLKKAADSLLNDSKHKNLKAGMEAFRQQNPWVEDSALFHCLANFEPDSKDTAWWTWPEPLRKRDAKTLEQMVFKYKDEINRFITLQFLFDKQWKAVKAYANEQNVKIVGDMPIYVGGQSADVWAHQELFQLSESGAPAEVSGVPPDAFSETGQLWGSPLYDWKAHEKEGFQWWAQRLARSFELHDETRIDHFRGFAGYWAVDAKAETAMGGVWKKGPSKKLFEALEQKLGHVPIIAEDLGVITSDVNDLRKAIGAPGMVVLQFAWGSGARNTHLPHNHYENSVCYPGTHDNETSVGWWKDSAQKQDKDYLQRYMNTDGKDIAWDFIWEAYKSVSRTSIMLLQDIMRLDNKARMNFPGTTEGNWAWRVGDSDVWSKLKQEAKDLHQLAEDYDRLPQLTFTIKP
jgi:4-alpha-glucanotransferase